MPDHKEKKNSYMDFLANAASTIDTNLTNKPRTIGDKGDVQRSLDKRKSRIVKNYKDGQDAQEFKQGDKTLRVETAKEPKLSGKEKRVYDRVTKRKQKQDERRDRRASLVAIRKGMSKDQAKDFMANRRARFNAATKEYFKGLVGAEQNLDNIKDRAFRKDGSGTLQNVKAADGTTYDSTAAFKGEGSGYTGRGQTRKTGPDNYLKFNSKVDTSIPSSKINYMDLLDPIRGDNAVKEQQKEKENITTNTVKDLIDPPKSPTYNDPTDGFPGTLMQEGGTFTQNVVYKPEEKGKTYFAGVPGGGGIRMSNTKPQPVPSMGDLFQSFKNLFGR